MRLSAFTRIAAVIVLASSASACVPMLVGGAVVGTTAVATDRRTAAMQVEDEAIEFKIRDLLNSEYGYKVNVLISSYNGNVLLVGAVPDETTRDRVGRIAEKVQGVRDVANQVVVGPARTVGEATNDTLISGQVRAALIGTTNLTSNAFVITTYRNKVYLQGRVTEAEGDSAARVVSGLRGVNQVITLFQTISQEEANRLTHQPDSSASTLPTFNTGDATPTNSSVVPTADVVPQSATSSANTMPSGGALAIPIPVAQ